MFQSSWSDGEIATVIHPDQYTFAPRSTPLHSHYGGTRRIVTTPGVVGGKPRIAGRRISVEQVVIWHEHSGMSREQIASEFDLSLTDIDAAMSYYRSHRDDIDAAIRATDEYVTIMEQQTPSILR